MTTLGGTDEDYTRGYSDGRAQMREDIAAWMRGDEAEAIARLAEKAGVPPEDALADAIEKGTMR